ncbi:manganese catalase family protein [Microcoleus sp. Pol7_A1]|uniref:manganese catalase family protein n=1 Tax=Microcoleus sp. Pol7_A1 TaxID=2818893 RepID=UPI002FD267F2
MFDHVKELEFNSRLSDPEPHLARLLLEQFGGYNSELKVAMHYFTEGLVARKSYRDKYDMVMDIATVVYH